MTIACNNLANRAMDSQMKIAMDRKSQEQFDRWTDRQTDGQTDRRTDRHTDNRQKDRQTDAVQ